MGFTSARERRLWFLAGSCLLLIYSSLYIARPITEWLREANLLRVAVVGSFLLALAWVGSRLLRVRAGWRVWASLAVITAGYALVLGRFELPEERLHFLEYGVVGGLIFAALMERQGNRPSDSTQGSPRRSPLGPAAGAVIATALAGWFDEGIQAILPNRFYDLRDVAMNAAGGALAVFAIWLLGLAHRAGPGPTNGSQGTLEDLG
jgi:hypothetical protein